MIETELIAIILSVGSLLPLLIAVVNQPHWSAKVRTILSVAVSGLAGLVTYVTENGLEFDSASAVVVAVVGVILASVASYQSIWKPSGIARRIENATSRQSPVLEENIPIDESTPDSW